MSFSDDILTVSELCEFLRIHRSTVYRLLNERNIPAFRVGSDWRFKRETIEQWMKERAALSTVTPTPPSKKGRKPSR